MLKDKCQSKFNIIIPGWDKMRNSLKVKLLQRFEFIIIIIDIAVGFYIVKDQSYFNIGLLIGIYKKQTQKL